MFTSLGSMCVCNFDFNFNYAMHFYILTFTISYLFYVSSLLTLLNAIVFFFVISLLIFKQFYSYFF